VLSTPARQGGVSTREEDKVIQVGALKAERFLVFHPEQSAFSQFRSALGTGRWLENGKDHYLFAFIRIRDASRHRSLLI
jgi:hypothetical protein